MTGGQGSFFDVLNEKQNIANQQSKNDANHVLEKHHLVILKADDAELVEHANYLAMLKKQGKCMWETE